MALPAGADGDAYACAGFDAAAGARVRLAARALPDAARQACLQRAASLRALSACSAIVVPFDAFETDGLFVSVTAPPLYALPDGPRPDGAALLLALRRVCDALLVLHSLGDAAAHGAASAGAVWYFSPGDADAAALPCLYVPPVPPTCGAADDLCAFGAALLPLLPPDAPDALCAILTRMRAGGYASALEIRHELNCL